MMNTTHRRMYPHLFLELATVNANIDQTPVPYAPLGEQPAKVSGRTKQFKALLAELLPAAEAECGITDENRNLDSIQDYCHRCGGGKVFKCWGHISGGVCFNCDGTGVEDIPMSRLLRQAREAARSKADWQLNADHYNWNGRKAALAEYVQEREEAARKHARDTERRAAYVPGYLAEVGEKVDAEVTVKFVKVIDGSYGASLLVSAVTDEGKVVKTFGTGETLWDLASKGARLRWTGTVKKHDSYDGQDQTITTRTKVAAI